MTPAISVLLPVYRPQLNYLASAIQSVLQQTFPDFELLIIEAASEVSIGPLLRKCSDDRMRHLIFEGHACLVDQLNYGLKQARAPLIARMDSDDWAYPERLQLQQQYLQNHPEIMVVGSQIGIMNADDRPLGYRRYPTEPSLVSQALRRSNPLAHPSVMYRKEPIMNVGGYCYRAYPANEDYELWCRLDKHGYQMANLEQTLLRYRIHPGSMKSERLKGILRGTRLVKRHYYGDTMTVADRVRFAAEGLLLNLPGNFILNLFQRMQYQRSTS